MVIRKSLLVGVDAYQIFIVKMQADKFRYGVRINVEDDKVYSNSITGEFRSEPIEEVLHLICLTSRLSYTITGKTITIRSAK